MVIYPEESPPVWGVLGATYRLDKATMKKVLGRTFVLLIQTIVTELEATLNDHPLTYMSADIRDPEPLTPAHLLYGCQIVLLPHCTSDISDLDYGVPTTANLRTRVLRHAQVLQHFQHHWMQEYLTSLREHQRATGSNEQCIKVGDVVLVHDDIPRGKWKMAVVEQLIWGKDGYARAGNIRYSEGRTNRPIAKLYPLKLLFPCNDNNKEHWHVTTSNPDISDDFSQTSTDSATSTRPTRNSAIIVQQKITNWTRMLLSPPPEDVED